MTHLLSYFALSIPHCILSYIVFLLTQKLTNLIYHEIIKITFECRSMPADVIASWSGKFR